MLNKYEIIEKLKSMNLNVGEKTLRNYANLIYNIQNSEYKELFLDPKISSKEISKNLKLNLDYVLHIRRALKLIGWYKEKKTWDKNLVKYTIKSCRKKLNEEDALHYFGEDFYNYFIKLFKKSNKPKNQSNNEAKERILGYMKENFLSTFKDLKENLKIEKSLLNKCINQLILENKISYLSPISSSHYLVKELKRSLFKNAALHYFSLDLENREKLKSKILNSIPLKIDSGDYRAISRFLKNLNLPEDLENEIIKKVKLRLKNE